MEEEVESIPNEIRNKCAESERIESRIKQIEEPSKTGNNNSYEAKKEELISPKERAPSPEIPHESIEVVIEQPIEENIPKTEYLPVIISGENQPEIMKEESKIEKKMREMEQELKAELEKREQIERLLKMRERQLQEMAVHLSEYNDNLQRVIQKGKQQETSIAELLSKLKKKDIALEQELKDKEIIFTSLQEVEKENNRLRGEVSRQVQRAIDAILQLDNKTLDPEDITANTPPTNKAKGLISKLFTWRKKVNEETKQIDSNIHTSVLDTMEITGLETTNIPTQAAPTDIRTPDELADQIRKNFAEETSL